MGLFDKLRNQLIDIIEWADDNRQIMVYRFERHGNEIKNGAKLIVREGQMAAFVNEGALADVFKPGTYELTTQNLPILTSLASWKYGFESPFKAEVFFVSTRRFSDFKWGTKNPIMLRDAEFGPIRLRAFGTYEVRIDDPAAFIREVVGTDGELTSDEITNQLRNMIITRFTDILGESKIPALDLASNYDELSQFVHDKISVEYKEYGLEVTKFLVENISLPPAVEEALDKRSSMGVLGNMQQYMQYQTAESIPKMAENQGLAGGLAGAGVGAGMGMAMGNQMANSFQQPQQQTAPPPVPQPVSFYAVINGQQAGPFDQNALRQQLATGQLTRETLVWKQGMAQWTAAGEVAEIQGLVDLVVLAAKAADVWRCSLPSLPSFCWCWSSPANPSPRTITCTPTVAPSTVKKLKGDLVHYSYHSVSDHVQRMDRYLTIDAEELFAKGKRANLFKMVFNPWFKFNRMFFLQLGFLDGLEGFTISQITAYGTFLRYIKLHYLQKASG